MDERGIGSLEEVTRVLNRERGMRSLFHAANSAPTDLAPLEHDEGAIAAGRSIDLTGVL